MSFSHGGDAYCWSENQSPQEPETPPESPGKPSKAGGIVSLVIMAALTYWGYNACFYVPPRQPTIRSAATRPATPPSTQPEEDASLGPGIRYMRDLDKKLNEVRARDYNSAEEYSRAVMKAMHELDEERDTEWREWKQKNKE
jgi:hypothetical protein